MSELETYYERIQREMDTAEDRRDKLLARLRAMSKPPSPRAKTRLWLRGEHPLGPKGYRYWRKQERIVGVPIVCIYSNDIRLVRGQQYTNLPGWFYRLAF